MKKILKYILSKIPFINLFINNDESYRKLNFKIWFIQKIIGFNRKAYWPMHFTSKVSYPENITIGKGTNPGLSPGCYIQGIGKIVMGDYIFVAPNVGIISANHDIYDLRNHIKKSVIIGNYCWIGMNSVILPGVVLGPHVIVGANSVVKDSFEDGYCIIVGNPAKIVKKINKTDVYDFEYKNEKIGYRKK